MALVLLIAFVLGAFAYFVILVRSFTNCPYCQARVRKDAAVCRRCGREVA